MPKNIATSIKHTEFLNFFFRNLQRVDTNQTQVLQQVNAEQDYPYVSPCGRLELNFVRSADLPIVFHGMIQDTPANEERLLVFGATLVQPFQPDKLAISPTTGRLYHELIKMTDESSVDDENSTTNIKNGSKVNHRLTTPLHTSDKLEYGLIRSSVAVSLSEFIIVADDKDDTDAAFSGMHFDCPITHCNFPIKWLPPEAQPGPSSMPDTEGIEIV